MFEFVCGIDDSEDEEFVTMEYKGLAGRGRLAASRPVGRQLGKCVEASFDDDRIYTYFIDSLVYIFLFILFGYSGQVWGFSIF